MEPIQKSITSPNHDDEDVGEETNHDEGDEIKDGVTKLKRRR